MSRVLGLFPFFTCTWLLLMLVPVRINLFFRRENKNDFLAIRVNTLFSLIRFQVEVPLLEQETPLDLTTEAELKVGEDKLALEKKKKLSILELDPAQVKRWARLLWSLRKRLRFLARFMMRAATVERFELRIRGGTADAAATGLLAGVFWATAGLVLAHMQKVMRLETKPVMTFTPDYSPKPVFNFVLDATVRYRVGHVTMSSLTMLVSLITGGEIVWKTIRSRG